MRVDLKKINEKYTQNIAGYLKINEEQFDEI